ncbi:MAG TPA: HAMP domain-containing protein, partial [Polyangiaceae bacterium]|nr:HAMP domain-containing protein [Polyangiaceae bacterium]
MRLSYKLSLGVGLALAVALGVDSVLAVERSVSEYEADLLTHTGQQAHTLAVSVSKLFTSFGDGGAIEVLDAANSASRGVRAHWVTLRTLLNSTLELTNGELTRLRSGLQVTRLVGAPERAAVAFSPVVIDRQVYGVVQVSQPAARRSALILGHAERTLTTAAALLLVSWIWASLIGVRWVGRPVRQLSAKAIRIGKGDFAEPLRLDTGDEFELLADTLNEACTELAASREA